MTYCLASMHDPVSRLVTICDGRRACHFHLLSARPINCCAESTAALSSVAFTGGSFAIELSWAGYSKMGLRLGLAANSDLEHRSRAGGGVGLGVAIRQFSRLALGPSQAWLDSITCAGSSRLHPRISQLCALLDCRIRRHPHPNSTPSRGRAAQAGCSYYADSMLAAVSCTRNDCLHRAPQIRYPGRRV